MTKVIKKTAIAITVLAIIISSLLMLASCASKPEVLKEDTRFYIDAANSKIKKFPLNYLLDKKESYFELRSDGTAYMKIAVHESVIPLLNNLVSGLNVSQSDLQLVADLGTEYLPGFDLEDLSKTFGLVENALNLKLSGIDFDDPEVVSMFQEIFRTADLSKFKLEKGLVLEYNCQYYIKDQYSKYSGKYTGVYMGKHQENGEPYMLLDLRYDEEKGKRKLTLTKEMIDLVLVAYEE